MCFGCSKEPSHRDGSFEHPQHMFWLRNKKNNFQFHTLIWEPGIFSWCGPCKTLGPRLEALIASQKGKVILAKVDVDEQDELAMAYKVSTVQSVTLLVRT